jgi:hypothetical protein
MHNGGFQQDFSTNCFESSSNPIFLPMAPHWQVDTAASATNNSLLPAQSLPQVQEEGISQRLKVVFPLQRHNRRMQFRGQSTQIGTGVVNYPNVIQRHQWTFPSGTHLQITEGHHVTSIDVFGSQARGHNLTAHHHCITAPGPSEGNPMRQANMHWRNESISASADFFSHYSKDDQCDF